MIAVTYELYVTAINYAHFELKPVHPACFTGWLKHAAMKLIPALFCGVGVEKFLLTQ
jgi:hypothetical protein